MLSNSISLTVDKLNTGANQVTEVLTRYNEEMNRTLYKVEGTHTLSARDQVQFYRTFPKRTGVTRGSAKSAIKITMDVTVPNAAGDGDIVMPLILEASFSVPVGVTPAVTMALRQRMVSLLDLDSVSAKVVDELDI